MSADALPSKPPRKLRRAGTCRILLLGLLSIPSWPVVALEPLPMKNVADGVFVHQAAPVLADAQNAGAIANVGFIVGRKAVAVIDTGGSRRAGERLLAAVRARTDLPIFYVINTHMHPDHVLGNAAFAAENPNFVGHHKLPRALEVRAQNYEESARRQLGDAYAGTEVVIPGTRVNGALTLDLGARLIHLTAWPTAHTDNDLTVFDEQTGTLFLGDLLFTDHLPVIDGSLIGWRTVMRDIQRILARHAVPGHGAVPADWPTAMIPQERYLTRLEADIRAHLRDGRTMAEAAKQAGQSERDAWHLFEDFNARNAIAAYHELEWD